MSEVTHIDSKQLAELLAGDEKIQLIDVREPQEVAINRIPGATHIAMNTIPQRIGELDPKLPTVVYCHHGQRSFAVGSFLIQHGFENVANLHGGINDYAAVVDRSLGFY